MDRKSFIRNTVIALRDKWLDEYGIEACDINSGECESFAEQLQDELKQSGIDSEILSDGLFFDPFGDEEPGLMWDPSEYGKKPLDFEKVGLPSHYWVFCDGLHYDSDAPNGVKDMFQLPIIRDFYRRKSLNESLIRLMVRRAVKGTRLGI